MFGSCLSVCLSTYICHVVSEPHVYLLALKAEQLSVMVLWRDLMKKREDQMLKEVGELLGQRTHLRERLVGKSLNQYLHLVSD